MNTKPPTDLRSLITRPSWQRRVLIHRFLAAVLVIVAVALFFTPDRDQVAVYVATRNIAAGEPVGETDFRRAHVPEAAVPATAADFDPTRADAAVAPITTGEIMTPARVLHPLSAAHLGGDGATLVPVTLQSPDVAALVQHGDTVAVIAATREADPEILAETARVALPAFESDTRSAATIVVAVDSATAVRIAAAATAAPLTVVIKHPS